MLLTALVLAACSVLASPPNENAGRAGVGSKRASHLTLPDLDPEDWRRAHGALGIALDPAADGARVSWDNPQSGRKDALLPTALPFVRDGQSCRPFPATVEDRNGVAERHGLACRELALAEAASGSQGLRAGAG